MSIYHVCPYIIICMNFLLLGEDEYGIGKVSGEWLHFLLWCQHTDLGAVYGTSSSSSTYSLGTTEVNIHCPTMNTCFPYIAVLCAPQATIAYSYSDNWATFHGSVHDRRWEVGWPRDEDKLQLAPANQPRLDQP